MAAEPGSEARDAAIRRLATHRTATDLAAAAACSGLSDISVAVEEHKDEPARFAKLFSQAPSFMAYLRGPTHVFEFANANYLKLVGNRAVLGRTVAMALPDAVEQGYLELLDRVFKSGVAYSAESAKYLMKVGDDAPTVELYVDFVFQPLRDIHGNVEGIFVEGIDTTDRVVAQMRREALSALTERIAEAKSAAEIGFCVAEMLGNSLSVSRVGLGSIDHHLETLMVERDWCAPGVESLAGVTYLRDYGSFIDSLKKNEFIAIADVREDPRTCMAASSLEAKSARSFVNVPVVEAGNLEAVFFVNSDQVRHWTVSELAFVKEAGQRAINWLERFKKTLALKKSETRLLAATEAAQLGFWDLDLATSTLDASLHCKKNFGRDLHEAFTYSELLDSVHPDDKLRMRKAVGESLATGQTYDIEYRIIRPDGKLAWVRVTGEVKYDADGVPSSMVGISQEITDLMFSRRRAELLEFLDRKVYNDAEGADDVAYKAAEALGRVLDVSRAGYGTIDKQAETITIARDWNAQGIQTLAGTLHFRDFGSYIEDLKRGETVVFEDARKDPRTLDTADALIAISAQAVVNMPVSEAGNFVALLYLNNATARPWTTDEMALIKEVANRTRQAVERRRAEEDLKLLAGTLEQQVQQRTSELMKTEAILRQSQKMEAVGQLTGGLAHDFNNLLAAMSGSYELLKRKLNGNGDLIPYIDVGQRAVKRAASLTHRLLAFSRQQALEPKVLDVNQLVGGFEDLIRRTIGPQVDLEVVGCVDLWPVNADPGQLENALLNLCINARDAMPEGGRLVVELANCDLDGRFAGELEIPPGKYISISVSDEGCGMDTMAVARAFDPFFTTKPLGMGTGLGLSMVYGFTRQSGGQVRIHSTLGSGTSVRIYLPRYDGGAGISTEEPVGEVLPAQSDHGEMILVVDDEGPVRVLMAEMLTELGYRVLEADDGSSALASLHATPSISILVTDVGLTGGMNGRHLADAARMIRPELKVLFVTGYAENAALSNGCLPEGMQVLTKPFDLSVFGVKVKTLVNTR